MTSLDEVVSGALLVASGRSGWRQGSCTQFEAASDRLSVRRWPAGTLRAPYSRIIVDKFYSGDHGRLPPNDAERSDLTQLLDRSVATAVAR